MKKTLVHLALAALILAAASCSKTPKEETSTSTTTTETPQQSAPVARGEATTVHMSFSVEAVDVEKRHITLKGPEGHTGVFEVGDQVKRLSEIKAGDTIHADYTVGAVAELREPTAEEKSAPLTEVTGVARGTAEEPPAGGIGRVVRAVASIESLDPAAQSATVKGPEEGLVTVHVEDPAVFNSLKVGQPVVVTFAEKLVLTVQPGAKS
jgi:ABC-type Zn uptake system ZnuABC Zn-binding protein ZnuA